MKKWMMLSLACFLIVFSCGCSKTEEKTVFDEIRDSPAAKLELPDGTSTIVDGEIAALRSFADLNIVPSSPETIDDEEDWLYRITFNPAGRGG